MVREISPVRPGQYTPVFIAMDGRRVLHCQLSTLQTTSVLLQTSVSVHQGVTITLKF